MRSVLLQARAFLIGFWRALRRTRPAYATDVAAFLEDLFERFPFSAAGEQWLRDHVWVEVGDLSSVRGGGLFFPGQSRVRLNTGQYEAAIHELAHAWWHPRRSAQRDEFIAAVVQTAREPDPHYSRIADLARGYVFGLEDVGFPGFLKDGNDGEMYAGLASGCMADIRLLPPYLRPYFEGLFEILPAGSPPPELSAPHG
jgi:hypothetical protein